LGQPFNSKWDSTIGASVTTSIALKYKWQKQKIFNYSSRLAAQIMAEKVESRIRNHETADETGVSTPITSLKTGGGDTISGEETLPSFEKADFLKSKDHRLSVSLEEKYHPALVLNAMDTVNTFTLSLWDFGGQETFYTMHHIFLTRSGIYLLVFDTRELLETSKSLNASNYILFWLRSIKMHAPAAPLLLVGTFSGDTKGEHNIVDEQVREIVKKSGNKSVVNAGKHMFYAIDNRLRLGIDFLRNSIDLLMKQSDSMNATISMRWTVFLDELLNQNENYLSFGSCVKQIGEKWGLYSTEEQWEALSYFHEKGFLIHLKATETLSNYVIIQPQWLIDMICRLIRDSSLHTNYVEFENVGLLADARRTFEEGITSRDFLEYLWDGEPIDFLVDIMKRTMLMSEWIDNDMFLIPSNLKRDGQNPRFDYQERCLNSEDEWKTNTFAFRCDFTSGYLPIGVFQRLICLLVEYSSWKSSESRKEGVFLLQSNFASLEFFRNNNFQSDFVMELFENSQSQAIEVNIFLEDSSYERETIAKVAKIIRSMLLKINSDVMNSSLTYNLEFGDDNNALLESSRSKSLAEEVDLYRFLENL